MKYTAFFNKSAKALGTSKNTWWKDFPTFTAALSAVRKSGGAGVIETHDRAYENCYFNVTCAGSVFIYDNRGGHEEFYATKGASDYAEIKAIAEATEGATFNEI